MKTAADPKTFLNMNEFDARSPNEREKQKYNAYQSQMRTNFDQIEEVISELSLINKSNKDTVTVGTGQTQKEAAPMLEGTGSSRKRYHNSPVNPLGSLDRSGQRSPNMNQSIEQVKVPAIGTFDTLLNRASQQRRSANT